jgi:ribonuclease E
MLVNVTHVEESRVAILDGGVLAAYEIETINRTSLKGNIHNAVVESVLPSLEAAFVKIAPDLNGFLPLDEVNFRLLPSRGDSRKSGRISQHLHTGQKILAQVVREPFAGKPPTVSTYFSLPGRFLVLMPGVDSSGISRKIEDGAQRDRLKKILDELRPPEGFGVIVRTAGLGQTKTELQRDMRYLLRLWESIQRSSKATEFPAIVYREADLVIRTIRDHLTSDIQEVWIDSEETYEKALAFVRDVMPTRAKIIKLYTGERPLFNKFNLEEQIERIYKRRVPLPSGGEIVIDGTEALTAIDVNTARAKKKSDAEESSLQTNLEAAEEIARQLRLRDLGGLVVIDFIDMLKTGNKKKVEKAVKDAMRGDKARHDITRLSKLGLMEVARQRIKGAKMAASYATCPSCDGYGLIKNVETAGLAALRKLQTRSARRDCGRLRVVLPPEVSTWLVNNKREELVRIERRHGVTIEIEPKAALLRHEIEFESSPRVKGEEPTARAGELPPEPPRTEKAPVAEQASTAASPATDGAEKQPAASGERKRRGRRRRGGGKGAEATEPPGEATGATAGEGENILPFAPPDAGRDMEPTAGAAEPAEERPRRRRRRRRRSSSTGGAENGSANGAPSGVEPDGDSEEAIVPRGVQSNELMPAAAPRSARSSKSPGKRRRKSSKRGSRTQG